MSSKQNNKDTIDIAEQFIYNLKVFVVGVILWVIIVWYLQNHPGERQAIMPSLQTLYHKAQVSIYGLFGRDVEQLETKFALQRIYSEINYLIESSNCQDEELLAQVQEHKDAVDNLSNSQAQNNRFNYYRQAANLKNRIEQQCAGGLVESVAEIIDENDVE